MKGLRRLRFENDRVDLARSEDVVDRLDPDREPDTVVADAAGDLLGGRELLLQELGLVLLGGIVRVRFVLSIWRLLKS